MVISWSTSMQKKETINDLVLIFTTKQTYISIYSKKQKSAPTNHLSFVLFLVQKEQGNSISNNCQKVSRFFLVECRRKMKLQNFIVSFFYINMITHFTCLYLFFPKKIFEKNPHDLSFKQVKRLFLSKCWSVARRSMYLQISRETRNFKHTGLSFPWET